MSVGILDWQFLNQQICKIPFWMNDRNLYELYVCLNVGAVEEKEMEMEMEMANEVQITKSVYICLIALRKLRTWK